jgi:nucleotide-binding universal stress UspA family protein
MFRTILVPLDGTDYTEQALPVAQAIARRTGACLRLAHVHVPAVTGEVFDGPCDLECRVKERQALERIAKEVNAIGIPATAELLDGPVIDTLAWFAERVGADLVVMTTHGRSLLTRALLGSVADSLVRHLTVPTLLIHPVADMGRGAPVRHLLIALDGSPESEAMLPRALKLGEAMGAKFTLARVAEMEVNYDLIPSAGVAVPYPDDVATRVAHTVALDYLERLAAPLRARGLDVQTRVVDDPDPAAAIIEMGHALGCDLIALESHGRTGLARLVFGSVTDAVVRHGDTPVLTHVTNG